MLRFHHHSDSLRMDRAENRLRDLLAELCDSIKHKPLRFAAMQATEDWQHPKNLNTLLLDGECLGLLGVVHPSVQDKLDRKAAVVYAELDVSAFTQVPRAPIDYRVPSRFPGMEQDLTVYASRFAPIQEAVEEVNSPLIQKLSVVSTFVDAGGQTISVRLFFSHPERTLTGEEVQQVMDSLLAALEKRGIQLKR